MSEKKTDLRVLKTRDNIRRAYLELLRTHTAKEITVPRSAGWHASTGAPFTCTIPTPMPCWIPLSGIWWRSCRW